MTLVGFGRHSGSYGGDSRWSNGAPYLVDEAGGLATGMLRPLPSDEVGDFGSGAMVMTTMVEPLMILSPKSIKKTFLDYLTTEVLELAGNAVRITR
ncbi:hypothetical protein CASFOL_027404 [Castilleja foliolosa]|uniref:Uncharacterized protein n=1 Tax=Castilleja foliolosa TaxID=1961234 RepID=A0ABD3CER4_9LAMI